MMDVEEWRDIPGYEGFYQVSNLGRVKSLDIMVNGGKSLYKKMGRMRKPVLNSQNGYLTVVLCKNGKHTTCYLHRLVARAFCPGYMPDMVVNHINEIKTDNRASNLEWCTKSYNNLYANKPLRSAKPVYQAGLDGAYIARWASAREASQKLGVEFKNISACCLGKRCSAGGYRWRFADE